MHARRLVGGAVAFAAVALLAQTLFACRSCPGQETVRQDEKEITAERACAGFAKGVFDRTPGSCEAFCDSSYTHCIPDQLFQMRWSEARGEVLRNADAGGTDPGPPACPTPEGGGTTIKVICREQKATEDLTPLSCGAEA